MIEDYERDFLKEQYLIKDIEDIIKLDDESESPWRNRESEFEYTLPF